MNGSQRSKLSQPELRTEKLERYKKEFDIPQYDAEIITGSKKMADLFEATTAICEKPKKVCKLADRRDLASDERQWNGAGRS